MNSTKTLNSSASGPLTLGGLSLVRVIRRDPFQFFTTLANRGASHHWLKLGAQNVLFLADPMAIRHVFQSDPTHYHKSRYYQHLSPILHNAMLTSEEELWRGQRTAAAPAFAPSCYAHYCDDIEAATAAMCARLEQHAKSGEAVDIYQECLWLALDIVFRSFFHEEDADVKDKINDALGTMLRMAERRVWNVINLPMQMVVRFPTYRRCLGYLRSLTESLIAKRRTNQQYPDDLLSRLIALYSEESPEARQLLRNNILAVIIAGHETTACNLAWAFYELARNRRAQQTLHAEVDLALTTAPITQTTLRALPYTQQVLAEALRLYPPVWTVSRDAMAPDCIPLADGSTINVPSGTTVMLCAFALHRAEQFWSDPECFLPERFANTPDKGVYFPFGSGHRTCIGMQFAKVETAIGLARALHRFEFSLIPGQDIRPEPTITLRPNKAVLLRVKQRTPSVAESSSKLPEALAKCPRELSVAE